MKVIGYTTGSGEQAVPLVVGIDTVYVHTDITPVETDSEGDPAHNLFRYHEVQYDKDEYMHLMAEQNDELNQLVNTILGVTEDAE